MPPKEEMTDFWKRVAAGVLATLLFCVISGGFFGFIQTQQNKKDITELKEIIENLSEQQGIFQRYMHQSTVYQEQMAQYLKESKDATKEISRSINNIDLRLSKLETIKDID